MDFTGERFIPEAKGVEPAYASKMYDEHAARSRFAAEVVKGKLAQRFHEFAEEQRRRDDAERLVQQMTQSNSWRATRPLRMLRCAVDARRRRRTAGAMLVVGTQAVQHLTNRRPNGVG